MRLLIATPLHLFQLDLSSGRLTELRSGDGELLRPDVDPRRHVRRPLILEWTQFRGQCGVPRVWWSRWFGIG
jgi:hypothetical protein